MFYSNMRLGARKLKRYPYDSSPTMYHRGGHFWRTTVGLRGADLTTPWSHGFDVVGHTNARVGNRW